MAAEAIAGLTGYDRLVVAARTTDVEAYGYDAIEHAFAEWGAEIADVGATSSHVETVRAAIDVASIHDSFVAKDCDNFFRLNVHARAMTDHSAFNANWVAVAAFDRFPRVSAGNKGTVRIKHGEIQALSDGPLSEVIGSNFLAGAYAFADAERFWQETQCVGRMAGAVALLMAEGITFYDRPVEAYEDWGTLEDWRAYVATFKTLFVDIDGVLFHSSFPPKWGTDPAVVLDNIVILRELLACGRTQLVFTTARPERLREKTVEQLNMLGLHAHSLVMGLFNAERVIVNDVAPGRAPTARAICIERDAPVLRRLLEEL